MQPDPQDPPEPSSRWLALYALLAGVGIVGTAMLLLDLLEPYGSGLAAGAALGVAVAGTIAAVEVGQPVTRWLAGGRR